MNFYREAGWVLVCIKMCLARALQLAWSECQRRNLGFALESELIPFMWFSDNCFIFAHSPSDFKEICALLRSSLAPAGWRLPDDRFEYQADAYVNQDELAMLPSDFVSHDLNSSMKALGAWISVQGHTAPDLSFKLLLLAQASLRRHQKRWSTPGVARKSKFNLMFRTFSSAFSRCVGPWRLTQTQLGKIRSVFFLEDKRYLRVHRIWGDTDAIFAKRVAKTYRQTQTSLKLPDMDVHVVSHIYNYIGHVVRMGWGLIPSYR